MKKKVDVKIERDAYYFYFQYGEGAKWEKARIADLPLTVVRFLNIFTSTDYDALIHGKEYIGI